MVKSAVGLILLIALVAGATAQGDAKSASGAGSAATVGGADQDNKSGQGADKRAEAAKKYLEGRRLEETGDFSRAVAAYKEAIALDPQSVDLRVTLGSLYLKNRNVIDAEAQAREAIKL